MRQYHAMGDMLDEMKTYGFGAGIESMLKRASDSDGNGYSWLTHVEDEA